MTTEAQAPLPATFTSAEAARLGLSRRRLLALQEEGTIERISRGMYRRTDAEIADFDLIEIAIKAPKATLCLTSALARHDLTDTVPSAIDIALPRGEWQPITSAPVTWHKFAPATFEIGRTTLQIDSEHEIGLYDAMRTIIDTFRLRHTLGDDMAYEALRRWLRQRGQPSELMAMAQRFPKAFPAILQALQVLG
jgi:predicted transcriptional regulator of viral defense system